MRYASVECTAVEPRRRRRRLGFLVCARWRRPALERMTFPRARDLETLGHGLLGFDAFGSSHKILNLYRKRAQTIAGGGGIRQVDFFEFNLGPAACHRRRSQLIFAPMKYRRFGRTELAMPVISCGGMRYQFKWQDVDPKDIPRDNQENLEADHPPRARTGHQPHRNRARLRHLRNAAGQRAAETAARQNHRPDQGRAQGDREGISRNVRDFDEVSEARPRGFAVAARHQQPGVAGLVAEEGRLPGGRAPAAKGRPGCGSSAFPRTRRPTSFWKR